MKIYQVVFLFILSLLNLDAIALACPKYKDPIFFEKKQNAESNGDYESYFEEIDTSNGICLMQKYAEKGNIILLGLVDKEKCEGVKYLRRALLENIKTNKGTSLFEPNERWALQFLNIYYNGAYFQISAIEGDNYSRFKVAELMFKKLSDGYDQILGNELSFYNRTILDYLSSSEIIPELKDEATAMAAELQTKFGKASDKPHIDTHPRKVICDAS